MAFNSLSVSAGEWWFQYLWTIAEDNHKDDIRLSLTLPKAISLLYKKI